MRRISGQRSNTHALRPGGRGDLFAKQDMNLGKYVIPDASAPRGNSSTSQDTTVTPEQKRVQERDDDDFALFADFIGRGELADQSYTPQGEVALTPIAAKRKSLDPCETPDENDSHDGHNASASLKPPAIKFVQPSGHLPEPQFAHAWWSPAEDLDAIFLFASKADSSGSLGGNTLLCP